MVHHGVRCGTCNPQGEKHEHRAAAPWRVRSAANGASTLAAAAAVAVEGRPELSR